MKIAKPFSRPWILRATLAIALPALATSCDDDTEADDDHGDTDDDHDDDHDGDDDHDDHDHNDETEVVTRVELAFTPEGGGTPFTATFNDPDGDAGMSGMIDDITLTANTTYQVSITSFNELVSPPEDVTEEIREEAEEHQIFFAGSITDSLVTVTYGDTETTYGENSVGDDLPVGLLTTLTTTDAGMGELIVQQQHLSEVNGEPVKTPGLEDVYPDLPGDPDWELTFAVEITAE